MSDHLAQRRANNILVALSEAITEDETFLAASTSDEESLDGESEETRAALLAALGETSDRADLRDSSSATRTVGRDAISLFAYMVPRRSAFVLPAATSLFMHLAVVALALTYGLVEPRMHEAGSGSPRITYLVPTQSAKRRPPPIRLFAPTGSVGLPQADRDTEQALKSWRSLSGARIEAGQDAFDAARLLERQEMLAQNYIEALRAATRDLPALTEPRLQKLLDNATRAETAFTTYYESAKGMVEDAKRKVPNNPQLAEALNAHKRIVEQQRAEFRRLAERMRQELPKFAVTETNGIEIWIYHGGHFAWMAERFRAVVAIGGPGPHILQAFAQQGNRLQEVPVASIATGQYWITETRGGLFRDLLARNPAAAAVYVLFPEEVHARMLAAMERAAATRGLQGRISRGDIWIDPSAADGFRIGQLVSAPKANRE